MKFHCLVFRRNSYPVCKWYEADDEACACFAAWLDRWDCPDGAPLIEPTERGWRASLNGNSIEVRIMERRTA